jgi:hypothetical protein
MVESLILLVRLAGFPSTRSGQAYFATREFVTEGCKVLEKNGAPGGIRTPDLRIRSPLLYPAELQAQKCHVLKFLSRQGGKFIQLLV